MRILLLMEDKNSIGYFFSASWARILLDVSGGVEMEV